MTDGPASTGKRHLPDLGPRGEGWVVGQVALIGLAILLGRSGLGRLPPESVIGWVAFIIGTGAIAVGCWLLIRAVVDLGGRVTPWPRPRPDARLVESGIYASLRHPIYAGLILASLGWSALTTSPAAFVASFLLAALLDGKARREEAWLLERYEGYAAYRRRSKRFVPRIY